MLEALAHQQLKALLRQEGAAEWPHHLSLSRLVARSLRRSDHTLIRLTPGTGPDWWISLLVPLALSDAPLALVLSQDLRQRLLQMELPRLRAVNLALPLWEGSGPCPPHRIWLLDHAELMEAWRNGQLGEHQLVIPEAETLEPKLRRSLAVRITADDWNRLLRSQPAAETSLMALHDRLSRRVLEPPRQPSGLVAIAPEEEAPLRQLLALLGPLPPPWDQWLEQGGDGWSSWAEVDMRLLQWTLHRQPLEPLHALAGLLRGRGAVLLGQLASPIAVRRSTQAHGAAPEAVLGLTPEVVVDLGDPPLADPLPLFAPLRQPLPNSPVFAQHLLEQSRRLVLGQARLSVILCDDEGLRLSLASAMAAEFGRRVEHESTTPDANGILCARWSWWLEQQERLPLPGQILAATLPIASLEDPLTAARVTALRQQGLDWFRELLLPEAVNRLQRSVAGLRRGGGRLAVLDGRLRSRSWGATVLRALEPWASLSRLLPN
ncbi:helicase [Synechococcus sp. CBW1002]|uniref:helicase n=1 Tax=Synechococcus sp. CBW1002 TaxID=1353134 RepID=UPI0018CD868F|nr:helicase [Synechococcus sp. CBW1002]QPN61244.1 helicase [Synechococcus sp. CBW1002]